MSVMAFYQKPFTQSSENNKLFSSDRTYGLWFRKPSPGKEKKPANTGMVKVYGLRKVGVLLYDFLIGKARLVGFEPTAFGSGDQHSIL